MKLYRIKRKSDGKNWSGFKWNGDQNWTDSPGVFYRNIDPVKLNLRWICSRVKWNGWGSRRTVGYKNFNPVYKKEWLELYEVIIMDVSFNSSQKIEAADLFKRDST